MQLMLSVASTASKRVGTVVHVPVNGGWCEGSGNIKSGSSMISESVVLVPAYVWK